MSTVLPPRWTREQLVDDAKIASLNFRNARLSPTQEWKSHYQSAMAKFEELFKSMDDLHPDCFTDENLSRVYKNNLGEALRYLAGPPISDDDLKVIADVESLAPAVLSKDYEALHRVFNVINQVVDPFRFPWILENRKPSPEEKNAALLASSVLLAAQRTATERRTSGKDKQENQLKKYFVSIGFKEVPTKSINTIVKGPQQGEFCGECQLGERKADVVLRLRDTRLMAIECKVSNSATNSVKRINNDAAAKAEYWIKQFGTSQIVPVAVLSGVFKVNNLLQAQERGLTLFWSHDLKKLEEFIRLTA